MGNIKGIGLAQHHLFAGIGHQEFHLFRQFQNPRHILYIRHLLHRLEIVFKLLCQCFDRSELAYDKGKGRVVEQAIEQMFRHDKLMAAAECLAMSITEQFLYT